MKYDIPIERYSSVYFIKIISKYEEYAIALKEMGFKRKNKKI